jgi:hypothetical protein
MAPDQSLPASSRPDAAQAACTRVPAARVMLPARAVIDLEDTYRRLATHWTQERLAAGYRDAEQHGARSTRGNHDALARPIAVLASAIPPSATLSVAINALHLLPHGNTGSVSQRRIASGLLDVAGTNAAGALHRVHRVLELDGSAHHYAADEWLPTIYDITAELLGSARVDAEPPTLVQAAQDTISWLSRAVVELDQDSPETPATLAEALARLLTGWVLANECQPDGASANHA